MSRQTQTSNVHITNAKALCLALSFALCGAFLSYQITGAEAQENSQLELKLVQVVFRHGNRTPVFPYDGDPNANETFFPYGWDQLDKGGREKAYELGRYLKNLYGKFVGDEYIPGIVNITCTDIPRTKMCAQLVGAGLFPPSNSQKWGPIGSLGQDWQPITFNYIPVEQDDFMYMDGVPCPAYSEEEKKFDNGPDHAAMLDTDKELVDALAKYANVERTVHAIETFHQILRIEIFHHLIVPDWIKPYYPERLMAMGEKHFHAKVFNRKMQRLYGGPLLGHILEIMERKRDGYPAKMWLYSAHDDTITRLGHAMRVWDGFYPDFSSALIVELLADSKGSHFVKAFFHNDTSRLPITLKVEGCEQLCPLDKFRTILQDAIPKSRKEECNSASIAYQNCLLMFSMLTLWFVLF